MRIVVAVEQIPYRLESQEQTLLKTLAQRGRDNRFNGPFRACQKRETVLSGLSLVKQKAFKLTLIEDKKWDIGIQGRDSNHVKHIWVPGS
jgi:hypothetical protein